MYKRQEKNAERLYGRKPEAVNCTNAWITGAGMEDVEKPAAVRGDRPEFYYNCFFRISGVEDKLTYLNEWYQFYLRMKNEGRKIVITEQTVSQPGMEEIAGIHRKNYQRQDQMLMDLSANIKYSANIELQRIMTKAFLDIMLDEAKLPGMNLNRLTNKAVYLLCWLCLLYTSDAADEL